MYKFQKVSKQQNRLTGTDNSIIHKKNQRIHKQSKVEELLTFKMLTNME